MRYLRLYRALLHFLPQAWDGLEALQISSLNAQKIQAFTNVLKRHKARGGALALFDASGLLDHLVYGEARKGQPVTGQTAFRLASLSKTVTAAGVLALHQKGALNIDEDADINLPFSLRAQGARDLPLTLFHLLTHTSGIKDGRAYGEGIESGAMASDLLKEDIYTGQMPGAACVYSNFGFGLIASVLEAKLGQSFQRIMAEALFEPLKLEAAYYPALISAPVADARRVLPPKRQPNFDGQSRQANLPAGWDTVDVERHYTLAQGACCADVQSLVRLGQALLNPGFFTEKSLEMMFSPHASLASRDPSLTQGLGLFILNDRTIAPKPLYGHQGMAYGAVQMMFLDQEKKRGLISLTTGASQAREHILTDLNKALLSVWQND